MMYNKRKGAVLGIFQHHGESHTLFLLALCTVKYQGHFRPRGILFSSRRIRLMNLCHQPTMTGTLVSICQRVTVWHICDIHNLWRKQCVLVVWGQAHWSSSQVNIRGLTLKTNKNMWDLDLNIHNQSKCRTSNCSCCPLWQIAEKDFNYTPKSMLHTWNPNLVLHPLYTLQCPSSVQNDKSTKQANFTSLPKMFSKMSFPEQPTTPSG